MKLSKILAGSILSSVAIFSSIQYANAQDLNLRFGTVPLILKDVSYDVDYGFDARVFINGTEYSSTQLDQLGQRLGALADDTQTIAIGTETVSLLVIKQGLIDFLDGNELNGILTARGANNQDITEIIAEVKEELGLSSNTPAGQSNRLTEVFSGNFINTPIQKATKIIKLHKEIESMKEDIVPFITAPMYGIINNIGSRLEALNSNEAVGGGDELAAKPGVWLKGMAGRDDFKIKGSKKLTTNSFTGVAGIDFKVMEELILGLSFGYQESKEKKSKQKMKAFAGSVYGLYYFNDRLFTNLQYSYGNVNLSNTDNAALSLFNKNNLHIGTAKLGYNFTANDNVLVTPAIGIRYGIHNAKTKEDKLKNYISTKLKKGSFAYALAEIKIASKIDLNNVTLQPHIKGGIEQLVNSKKTKLIITKKSSGKSKTYDITNAEKTRFTAGAGVTTSINNIDLGAEYTFTKTKIQKGHLGTLSLRVNL